MLHRCEDCPGSDHLQEFLESNICDEVDHIKYKQWVSTERTTLADHIAIPQKVTETLIKQMDKLAQHHYIAKHQSGFLNHLKSNISENKCIMRMCAWTLRKIMPFLCRILLRGTTGTTASAFPSASLVTV